MPNKNTIKLWVDALRSGKYKQVEGHLRENNSFCCLGVACEVYNQNNPDNEIKIEKGSYDIYFYDENSMTLPSRVQTWLETDENPEIIMTEYLLSKYPDLKPHEHSRLSVAELNDLLKFNFEIIADIIEDTFLKETKDDDTEY